MRTIPKVRLGAAFFVMGVLVILAGCKKQQRADLERETPIDVGVHTELLPAGADGFDEETLVGGRMVRLEAFLWRDFMPGPDSDPDGRALRGLVRVYSVNEESINGDIDIAYVWLRHDTLVWGVALPEPAPAEPRDAVEKSFAGGPMWEPETPVDVIVRIVDTRGLSSYLRLNDQEIMKTQ